MMDRIKVHKTLATIPLPCEYFDLMVGTSTGGIIALMLGRLKLDIDVAITRYKAFLAEIFGGTATGPDHADERLIAAINSISGTDTLADPDDKQVQCRVALAVVLQRAADSSPILLRTYVGKSSAPVCSIADAVRAATATDPFWSPATINMTKSVAVTFLDASIGCNNPTRIAVGEARQIWGADCQFGTIVSIGTGVTPYVHVSQNVEKDHEAMSRQILSSSRQVHEEMKALFGNLDKKGIYFRFDPVDLSSVGIDEWKELAKVGNLSYAYSQEHATEVSECVTELIQPVSCWTCGLSFSQTSRNCNLTIR